MASSDDSDDDMPLTSLGGGQKRKAPASKKMAKKPAVAAALEDSDDDSTDDLLNGPCTFRKSNRAAEKKRAKSQDFLNRMVADSDRQHESLVKRSSIMNQAAKNLGSEEDLHARVQAITAQPAVDTRRSSTIDECEGILDDPDGALTRDERKALYKIRDAEQSSCLGVRSILCFDASRNSDVVPSFVTSTEKAHEELLEILAELERGELGQKQQSVVDLSYADDLDKYIVQPLRTALAEETLPFFLSNERPVRLLLQQKKNNPSSSLLLPKEIGLWLLRVAESASLGSTPLQVLAHGALQTLVAVMKHGQCPELATVSTVEMFQASLECWVGSSDSSSAKEKSTRASDESKENAQPGDVKAKEIVIVNNVQGLSNLLVAWEATLPSVTASFQETTVTSCIVAVARLLLDQSVTSVTDMRQLSRHIQRVIAVLLETFRARSNSTDEQVVEWMKSTASKVVQDMADVGPGKAGAEDANDTEARLCLALAVRQFPTTDANDAWHKLSAQFKAILTMSALESCLDEEDMAAKTLSALQETGNQDLCDKGASSLGWLALLTSFSSLALFDQKNGEMFQDAARCLAVAELSFYAFDSGLSLLNAGVPDYAVQQLAKPLSESLNLIEDYCRRVFKKMQPLNTVPHFRRANYILRCYHQYYGDVQERASRLAGTKEKTKVQKEISDYFVKSDAVSPA